MEKEDQSKMGFSDRETKVQALHFGMKDRREHKNGRGQDMLFFFLLMASFLFYLSRLTHSALWYDEAVEYYYSKVLSGTVPGGFGTESMYERITQTYQPPLYNVLMHFWLCLFDGEFSFRLAGVLVSFLGALGLCAALRRVGDRFTSYCAALLYLFTTGISYYAMECGEYNLLLCCLSWTIYFYVRALNGERRGLFGFFFFSSLSVYSQYGAVFLVGAIYLSLVLHFVLAALGRSSTMIPERGRASLRLVCAGTVLTGVVAVLPLFYFFLLPQLGHQGIGTVSHAPAFVCQNPILDFLRAVIHQMYWNFCGNGTLGKLGGLSMTVLALPLPCCAMFCCLYVFLRKDCPALFRQTVLACALSFFAYYFSVLCSVYANNPWSPAIGSENFGNRYGLFFLPLWIFTMAYGVSLFLAPFRMRGKGQSGHGPFDEADDERGKHVGDAVDASQVGFRMEIGGLSVLVKAALILSLLLYFFVGIGVVYVNWTKDDVREAVEAWYADEGYREKTLIHQWSDANASFYITHAHGYDAAYAERLLPADTWIREADGAGMAEQLQRAGLYEEDGFYYIGPMRQIFGGSSLVFRACMEERGYHVTVLWDGMSVLYYVERG